MTRERAMKFAKIKLLADTLRARLRFSSDGERLIWTSDSRNPPQLRRKTAGHLDAEGYRIIWIGGRSYKAHRLVWKMVTGDEPVAILDHINGNRDDNRYENLRECDERVNCQNRRTGSARSSTGYLGVYRSNSAKWKYKAGIEVDGKSIHLGYFNDAALAHEAYLSAKRKIHQGCTI